MQGHTHTKYFTNLKIVSPKRWPAVSFGFVNKFLHCSILWSNEQWSPSVGIIKCYLSSLFACLHCLIHKFGGLEVTAVFCVVSIEITNVISFVPVYFP
jgi:hypothetical protein